MKIFQWPLGVATYRKFPRDIDLLEAFAPDEFHGPGKNGRRKFLCNLQATVRERDRCWQGETELETREYFISLPHSLSPLSFPFF